MTVAVPVREGRIPFLGFNTWYRIAGEPEAPGKLPLLCLHGGPGVPHDYLEPLDALADGRRVIYYDQLGCGNSDQPDDPSLWTVDLFLDELRAVRDALELTQFHLFGQSWGGMLAMEYALTQPGDIASLILASSPSSAPQWISEANRLRSELPPDIEATLRKHEAAGTTHDPEYQDAMGVFYGRHVCRLDEPPEVLIRTFTKMAENPQVYHTMCGPSEFHVVGVLKDWDITDRLGEIDLSTLVIAGRYDEMTPAIAETVQGAIPGAELRIFENCSHMVHLEEPEAFFQTVSEFIERVEQAQPT